ncbi:putative membrane protein [Clostridium argentinense CDC 2741]|uniref:Putative membrane protein n=1 Tax=Clostridium argentinense CDC 2741 TaxID=1418104 RepID=A0A0C1U0P2_9CLOT|nr:hypothetical protein [Clostridium argentinense]ARC85838.1 hypothetical protein RSJ17_15725 [Clostridium argentinense]KIE46389.1 putative membrane protein [Clostridium argentinense CDC 2741]NFF39923.1 hypothetical protein [Clostridium argentinense]NFP48554.1 hypothetical protein [Clostridium argentinense]NFP71178.1 hypothetical protein [Clostridium argentinense]
MVILPIISLIIIIMVLFTPIVNSTLIALGFIFISVVSSIISIKYASTAKGVNNKLAKVTINLCSVIIIMSMFALAFIIVLNVLTCLT